MDQLDATMTQIDGELPSHKEGIIAADSTSEYTKIKYEARIVKLAKKAREERKSSRQL